MFAGFPNRSPLLNMFYPSLIGAVFVWSRSHPPQEERCVTRRKGPWRGRPKSLRDLPSSSHCYKPEIRLYFCFARKAKFRQESATKYKFENIEDLPGRSQVISLPITNPRVKSLYMTSIYLNQDTPRGRKKYSQLPYFGGSSVQWCKLKALAEMIHAE